MAGDRKLDPPRRSPRKSASRNISGLVTIAFFLLPLFCLSQTQAAPELEKIKSFFAEQQWREVASLASQNPGRNPELYFYAGVALAQLGEFDKARSQLLQGRNSLPRDPRFPTELAGIEFKEKKYAAAAAWLRRARRLNPNDEYVDNFLATVYFVGGNLEAALKYWNRVNRPLVASVEVPKDLHTNPVLLDRALTFSPAAQLRLADFLTSESRLEGLDVFARQRLRLAATNNETFDVSLDAQERNGFGANKWQAILSTFRGVFYETVYPEYFNLHGSAVNFTSLLRWDAEKRRAFASISGPLRGNPKRRFSFNLDLRNENWNIRHSFSGPAPILGSLNLRKIAAGANLTSFSSGRLTWSTGVEISYRDYRNVLTGLTLTPNLLLEGTQIKAIANLRYDLLRIPERRWTSTFNGGSQISRIWADPTALFGKFEGSVDNRWLPRFEGDDYEVREKLSAGSIIGSFPFDELYSLGLERDNDLWLRAHIGTRDGRKGSAPLGRTYFLSNAEINKNLYSNGLVSLSLAPFLDSGKITGPAGLGSNKWLWDTGAEVKLKILSVGFTFIYGKDLRTGNNAFYLTATR